MAGADAAFEVLADPARLPDYVPTLTLEDDIAVDGELDVDADLAERDGAADAGFLPDRASRRISWGRPASDYGGSIEVAPGTTNSAEVTIRLQVRDDADVSEVSRLLDQAAANIRRMLLRR